MKIRMLLIAPLLLAGLTAFGAALPVPNGGKVDAGTHISIPLDTLNAKQKYKFSCNVKPVTNPEDIEIIPQFAPGTGKEIGFKKIFLNGKDITETGVGRLSLDYPNNTITVTGLSANPTKGATVMIRNIDQDMWFFVSNCRAN